ncbi:DUF3857 domain-containing protein [Sphingobacterium kyonggiense]
MRLKILLTISLFFVGLSVLFAQTTPKITRSETPAWLYKSTVQPKKVNLDDINDGYYIDLYENQTHLGLQTAYYKTIRVITEESGTENAGQIYVVYDPSIQKLQFHELKIIRNGQELDRLDLNKFKLLATERNLSNFIYDGTYSAHYVVDDLRKGDKLVFSYSLIGFNPVFEGKFSGNYYLNGGEPYGKVLLNYIVPSGRILNIKRHGSTPVEKRMEKDGLTYLFWDYTPEFNTENEDYIPSWYSTEDWIQVSEFSTWLEVNKWARRISPVVYLKPESDLAKFVDKLWDKAEGNKELFIGYCLDFVQDEVRYTGFEMGENSHRPHHPEKIFAQRFGDCKDKSYLLSTMLNHQAIPNSLVLANTYTDPFLGKFQANPLAFNHMVIAVQIDGKFKFLDPTISYQGNTVKNRFFPKYGKVLPIQGEGSLVAVEEASVSEIIIEDFITVLDNKKAQLKVITTYFGAEADVIRASFKQTAKNQLQKNYEEFYNKIYKSVERIDDIRFEDNREDNIFKVYEFYTLKDFMFSDELNQKFIPAYSSEIINRIPEINNNRLSPIQLNYPLRIDHIIKITNKDNRPIGSFTENHVFQGESYSMTHNAISYADTLMVNNILEYYQDHVPVNEVQKFIKDRKAAVDLFMNGYSVNNDGYLTIVNIFALFSYNGFALLFQFLLIAACIWYIVNVYNKRKPTSIVKIQEEESYNGLGGWLILVLIGMFFFIILYLILCFSPVGLAGKILWDRMAVHSGLKFGIGFLFLFISLSLAAISLVFCVYTTVLMLKRRDLFPQTFIFIRIAMAVQLLMSISGSFILGYRSENIIVEIGTLVVYLIGSAIWISYMLYSNRVKGTFTVPYKKEQYIIIDERKLTE